MWVKRFNSSGKESAYEVLTAYAAELIQTGGIPIVIFSLRKYYKDNNGEWAAVSNHEVSHVTIETLMNEFVVIDSPIDKELQSLREFKNNIYAKNLEESLAPFCLNKSVEVTDECLDCKNLNTNDKITLMDHVLLEVDATTNPVQTKTTIHGND